MAILGVFIVAGSVAKGDCVPAEDSSLSAAEYAHYGIAIADAGWDVPTYVEVLRSLRQVPSPALPRHRSLKSGEVFAQLMRGQATVLEALKKGTLADDIQHVRLENEGVSLDDIYTRGYQEGTRLDCELVLVRVSFLKGMLDFLPTLAPTKALIEELRRTDDHPETSESLAKRREKGLAALERAWRGASQDMVSRVLHVIDLLTDSRLSQDARLLLVSELSGVVQSIVAHTTEEDSLFLANRLTETAGKSENAIVRRELLLQCREFSGES